MASIFISRLVDKNLWSERLGPQHSIIDKSLIAIEPIQFDIPAADWVFFYSRNGVKHFFEHCQGQLAPYKWAAIGPKTAELLAEYVLEVDFIGNGKPDITTNQFLNVLASHERVCFARAEQSQKSVQKKLKSHQIIDTIVYTNNPISYKFSEGFDVLIFTSPLNVKAYFSNNIYSNEKVIAIGNTTAKALQKQKISDVLIPEESTLASVLDLVVRIMLR